MYMARRFHNFKQILLLRTFRRFQRCSEIPVRAISCGLSWKTVFSKEHRTPDPVVEYSLRDGARVDQTSSGCPRMPSHSYNIY